LVAAQVLVAALGPEPAVVAVEVAAVLVPAGALVVVEWIFS
jgi:hypothetical protein